MPPARLTPRQVHVLVTLYTDYRWSAVRLAAALGYGRRAIELALKRANVTLRRGRGVPAVELDDAAVIRWFTEAAAADRSAIDEPEPVRDAAGNYRRRRCQQCYRLNAYTRHCAGCGADMGDPDA